MDPKFLSVLKRFGRIALVAVVEEVVRQATGSPYAIILIPTLSAIGKWLREAKGMNGIPF